MHAFSIEATRVVTPTQRRKLARPGRLFVRWIPSGRTIWIADAHRDDGKRFIVRADEKLTAFLELEFVILYSGEAGCGGD
jgi:hypothetical protein